MQRDWHEATLRALLVAAALVAGLGALPGCGDGGRDVLDAVGLIDVDDRPWQQVDIVLGVTLVWNDEPYYYPPDVMEPYLRHVTERFYCAHEDPVSLLTGLVVYYQPTMPGDYAGLSWPEEGISWCDSTLVGNVDEYELSLQLAHRIRGPASEADDLTWFASLGITWGEYPFPR